MFYVPVSHSAVPSLRNDGSIQIPLQIICGDTLFFWLSRPVLRDFTRHLLDVLVLRCERLVCSGISVHYNMQDGNCISDSVVATRLYLCFVQLCL